MGRKIYPFKAIGVPGQKVHVKTYFEDLNEGEQGLFREYHK